MGTEAHSCAAGTARGPVPVPIEGPMQIARSADEWHDPSFCAGAELAEAHAANLEDELGDALFALAVHLRCLW